MILDPKHIVRMASSGVVFNEKREALLILRNDMPLWEPPGGVVDDGETHEQAMIREAKEEIGCDVAIKRCTAIIYRKIDDLPMDGYRHFRFFELDPLSTDIILDEHISYEWFPVDALPKNLAPLHKMSIEYAARNEPTREEISLLLDGKAFAKTLSNNDEIYQLAFWNTHPKVIAKREKGEIKHDPFNK